MRGIRRLGTTRDAGLFGLVVLTLAIGVGATTAVFTVVDGLLLRPLPYADSERLLEVWTEELPAAGRVPGLKPDVFRALRGDSRAFDAVEAYQFGVATLTGEGEDWFVSAPRFVLRRVARSPATCRHASPTGSIPPRCCGPTEVPVRGPIARTAHTGESPRFARVMRSLLSSRRPR